MDDVGLREGTPEIVLISGAGENEEVLSLTISIVRAQVYVPYRRGQRLLARE